MTVRENTRQLMAALTLQQRRFVRALLDDPQHNQTRAALAAGYAPTNAAQQGSRLYKNAKIMRAYNALQEEADAAALVDRVWLIQRMAAVVEAEDATNGERVAAGRLLAQMIGADQPKQEQQEAVRVEMAEEVSEWAV